MKIKIQKLELTNFKCFRSKEFQFGEDIVTIRGRNGVGKTTIFDAILWCLFGKNSQDQTKFNIKTTDEQGNIIPHLDHAVEMMITTNAITGPNEISLKHSVKEKWNKKRGATEEVFAGDTHEYFINGELTTAGDYKKYIDSMIDEQTFRILTNPQYFTSLKWKDQREILTRMVGSIEQEVIANTDDLVALVHLLDNSKDDIVSYRKHLSYQIKKVKEQLEKIPVRLEEQHKALPEKLDWDKIQSEAAAAKVEHDRLSDEIVKVKSGNGGDVLREQIRTDIKVIQQNIDKIEDAERKAYNLRKSDHDYNISELSHKFNETVNNQRLMEQTIAADERIIERCETSIKDFDVELQKLRDNWPNRKFEADPNAAYCPTCGQALPAELAEDRIKSMRDNFNKALEEEKQTLRNRAAKVKQSKEDAERELQTAKDKLTEHTEALAKMKEDINTVFSQKAKLEKEQVLSVEAALAEEKHYQELLQSREELRKKLDSVGMDEDSEKQLADLEAKRVEYVDVLQQLNTQLATKSQYDKIQGLIAGIEQEQKSLVEQLSELERKEDIARQYEDRQNEILESRVNEHFKITRWKMFRTVVNNGDPYNEPYCECYDLNGTAYHDGLNQAARLNIGLDICNAMSRVYNTSAPVIIDQSESTLSILPTSGQQLRLQVFDSDLQVV